MAEKSEEVAAEDRDGDEGGTLCLPDPIDMAEAPHTPRFRLMAERASLWHERAGPALVVSFDNLASIDTPYPREPWFAARIRAAGYSLLGVQTFAKDWFRSPDVPALLGDLAATGFFGKFDRIVLTGASMGGFAALVYAPLFPAPQVLAFSPQTTMSRAIVPFEARFPWATSRTDWQSPEWLDATASLPAIDRAVILFDPFVSQDRAHALRLEAPHTEFLPLPHATHEAVRVVVKAGMADEMLARMVAGRPFDASFWKAMRARRGNRKWARQLVADLEARGEPRRILCAADWLLTQSDYAFATTARERVLAAHPDLAPPPGADGQG